MEKHKFNEGDNVAHIDNLKQKMEIFHFYKNTVTVRTDWNDKTNKYNEEAKEQLRGIGCFWYGEPNKEGIRPLLEQKFHSKFLIPWDIAQKGKDAAIEYLKQCGVLYQ